jgi:hypothetical protein
MLQRSDWFAVIVAVFLLGAGAYMSTFPAEVIRALGILLMGAAAIGLIVWFALDRRARPAPPIVSPLCKTVDRDVSLLDAIWRVFMGTWGTRKKFWDGGDPAGNADWFNFWQICEDIQQRAFEGKLPIWAIKRGSQVYEPLPLDFWRHHRLGPNPMMDPEWPLGVWIEHSDGLEKFHRAGEWLNYSTSRELVDRLWPPAKEADV